MHGSCWHTAKLQLLTLQSQVKVLDQARPYWRHICTLKALTSSVGGSNLRGCVTRIFATAFTEQSRATTVRKFRTFMPSFLNVANNDGAMSKRRPRRRSRSAGVTTTPSRLPNTALKAAAAVLPAFTCRQGICRSTAYFDHVRHWSDEARVQKAIPNIKAWWNSINKTTGRGLVKHTQSAAKSTDNAPPGRRRRDHHH